MPSCRVASALFQHGTCLAADDAWSEIPVAADSVQRSVSSHSAPDCRKMQGRGKSTAIWETNEHFFFLHLPFIFSIYHT